MEYYDLERQLRSEAESISEGQKDWTPADVCRKLMEIADSMERIRRQHQTGIDASMGKRSGRKMEI